MTDERKTKPPTPSVTFMLKDVLKGDLMSSLKGAVDAKAVEELWKESRERMAPGALWVISATTVEQILPGAPAALKASFHEFRIGGGLKVVASAIDPRVIDFLRSAAKAAANTDITVVPTFNEALAIGKRIRDARDKK